MDNEENDAADEQETVRETDFYAWSPVEGPCLSTGEPLAGLACASRGEFSVRLGTLRVVTRYRRQSGA
jgi:hypothetical protein